MFLVTTVLIRDLRVKIYQNTLLRLDLSHSDNHFKYEVNRAPALESMRIYF